ncbi:DUF485 domain-containing protein [Streptomyces sp. SBST2-5]|uniref:DUF485 domain-containing protein n=1 Tax=Streptomyces composti TaxID=2720025 RepID=A0ABX1A3Y5_9ACTN|nr:DUF485 domain-containing protein [Streptomyces composti]NJP49935.1 DUF485 domain-containing protein [Streptomyces composti]
MTYDPYQPPPPRPDAPPPYRPDAAFRHGPGAHHPDASPPYAAYPWQPPLPPQAPPSGRATVPPAPLGHHSDLRILRSAYRWQRRVATLTALGYFTLFLILSAYAPSFMTGTVTDGLPRGLLLALGQVPVTWLAIALYEGTARRRVDPLAALIRKQAELDAKRGAAR